LDFNESYYRASSDFTNEKIIRFFHVLCKEGQDYKIYLSKEMISKIKQKHMPLQEVMRE